MAIALPIRTVGLLILTVVMLAGCRSANNERTILASHPTFTYPMLHAGRGGQAPAQTVQPNDATISNTGVQSVDMRKNDSQTNESINRSSDAVPFYAAAALSASDFSTADPSFDSASSDACNKGCCPK